MPTKTLISAEEFETICHEFEPCELVHGEVVQLSPGGMPHSRITSTITYLLAHWSRGRRCGRVYTNEAGLITETDPDTVRGADVAYFSYERLPKSAEPHGFSRTPPELVVEIIGRGQGWREMVEKAGEYLRMGVDRVWIVDGDAHRVHVFRPDGEPTVLEENQLLTDETILPGFSCRVSDFFEE